ncbi:MAG: hypothetical protein V3G53_01825 [Candidatus Enteromonas sp.]
MKKKFNYLPLIEAIFYVFVAICFYRFLWMFLIDIASKHDGGAPFYLFPTIYPRYLLMALHIYALFILHHLIRPYSAEGRRKTCLINGIILGALGLLLLIVCIVKIATGNAPIDSFWNISLMVVFDCPVWGVLYAFFGALMFFYAKKYMVKDETIYREKKGNIVLRFFRAFGAGAYTVFSLFYSGDFVSSILTFDHSFAHFWSMVPIYLIIMLFPASLIFYELVYNKENFDYVAKKRWQLLSSTILLGVILVSVVWLLIAKAVDPDFLTESGTALFPIEHMLFGIPAVGPIIALLFVGVASCLSIVNFIKPEKKEEAE